jgi:uncharacterized oligopeptide transporter (OPT) family protein
MFAGDLLKVYLGLFAVIFLIALIWLGIRHGGWDFPGALISAVIGAGVLSLLASGGRIYFKKRY